jgi:hypothetical protein
LEYELPLKVYEHDPGHGDGEGGAPPVFMYVVELLSDAAAGYEQELDILHQPFEENCV